MPKTVPDEVFELIFVEDGGKRFTQDSPILPEVWFEYLTKDRPPLVDLLLNPYRGRTPSQLRAALLERMSRDPNYVRRTRRKPLVFNETHVVGELWFEELIRCALPLTRWWREYVWRKELDQPASIGPELTSQVRRALDDPEQQAFSSDFLWLVRVVGYYAEKFLPPPATPVNRIERGLELMMGMPLPADLEKEEKTAMELIGEKPEQPYYLWSVTRNREASRAISKSCTTVKADAAKHLFRISCKGVRWGIIDSGVDARHPAFRQRDPRAMALPLFDPNDPNGPMRSRVTRTYDFTKLRTLLDPGGSAAEVWVEGNRFSRADRARLKSARERINELKVRLSTGRMLDWEELEPYLRVPHDRMYAPPRDEHGTHVAGILGANWCVGDLDAPPDVDGKPAPLEGMCPDIEIYDLRVLDEKGRGTEFEVLAALQFVRYMNAHKDTPIVQGVNLSLSIPHEVISYACGRTPVCEECERLVGNGVVVVVAAGNKGYSTGGGLVAAIGMADYQDISITDPGNADAVITVGATHRDMPHTYGVSYFSSRGPTGDGRAKPDLVAPGEKIKSVIPEGQVKSMDGTSMAAPHVSGAAALLMARHTELMGEPARIKQILCSTATDLGRTRPFQGGGMVDILRAIQSV